MAHGPVLESFFRHLASRCDKENDLSDITWALCESYPEVKLLFAKFLGAPASVQMVDLRREFKFGEGCRVDFVCWIHEIPLLIESKIKDQNCHLKQYQEEAQRVYPKSLLALLSMRELSPEEDAEARRRGWTVRRWAKFIDHLASQDFAGETLIQAYIKYARQVCAMVEVRPIKVDSESLYSLVSFQELANECINGASHGDFVYAAYKSARQDSGPGWAGIYYSITHKPSRHQVWPWFGLGLDGLDDPEVHIFLTVDTDWNKSFLKAHAGDLKRAHKTFRIRECDNHLSLHAPKGFIDRLVTGDLKTERKMLRELFVSANALLEEQASLGRPQLKATGSRVD